MKSRIELILLFLSVILLMMLFMYQVYNNLFAKDETKRIEHEREERRLQREEWLKNMERKKKRYITASFFCYVCNKYNHLLEGSKKSL